MGVASECGVVRVERCGQCMWGFEDRWVWPVSYLDLIFPPQIYI